MSETTSPPPAPGAGAGAAQPAPPQAFSAGLAILAGLDAGVRAALDYQKLELRIGRQNAALIREAGAATGWRMTLLTEMWQDADGQAQLLGFTDTAAAYLFKLAVHARVWPSDIVPVLRNYTTGPARD